MEPVYSLTDCPVCGKLVAIVLAEDWLDAQYLCPPCGKAFMFKIEEGTDDVDG